MWTLPKTNNKFNLSTRLRRNQLKIFVSAYWKNQGQLSMLKFDASSVNIYNVCSSRTRQAQLAWRSLLLLTKVEDDSLWIPRMLLLDSGPPPTLKTSTDEAEFHSRCSSYPTLWTKPWYCASTMPYFLDLVSFLQYYKIRFFMSINVENYLYNIM